MSMTLMYITNDPEVARIAACAGVERIFVDMEYIGKTERQGGMDTVQSHHTIEDIRKVRKALDEVKPEHTELMVRVNPIHEAGTYLGLPHTSTEEEIQAVLEAGADTIMLPYFKTKDEVRRFLHAVDGRAKTMLLLETEAAVHNLPQILSLPGIDFIHIGINDLSLDQGKTFMFQELADGTVDRICEQIRKAGIPYGFGGIASPGKGLLSAEYIIREHYRLGSGCAILSRSFCNTSLITDLAEIRRIFETGIPEIRAIEAEAARYTPEQYAANHAEVQKRVQLVVDEMLSK